MCHGSQLDCYFTCCCNLLHCQELMGTPVSAPPYDSLTGVSFVHREPFSVPSHGYFCPRSLTSIVNGTSERLLCHSCFGVPCVLPSTISVCTCIMCSLLTARCGEHLLTAHCSLLAACCSLIAVVNTCSLLTARCLLLAAH